MKRARIIVKGAVLRVGGIAAGSQAADYGFHENHKAYDVLILAQKRRKRATRTVHRGDTDPEIPHRGGKAPGHL